MSATLTLRDLPRLPADVYHARPELGSSTLKALHKDGPEVARAMYVGEVSFDSAAMRFGTIVHSLVECGDELAGRIVVAPDSYKTADSDKFAAWLMALPPDKIGMTTREHAAAVSMAATIERAVATKPRHMKRFAELSIFWKETLDDGSELNCKCRPDILLLDEYQRHAINIDVKTCRDNGPFAVRRSILSYGYYIQQAHYEAGIRSLLGPEWSVWTEFLFVRSNPTVAKFAKIAELDAIEARGLWRGLLDEWQRRTAANDWVDVMMGDVSIGLFGGDEIEHDEE